MRKIRGFLAFVAMVGFLAPLGATESVRQVDWENLVPEASPLINPLAHLSWDLQSEVELLANIRRQHARGLISDVDFRYEESLKIAYSLQKKGHDVDELVAKFETLRSEILRRNNAVVDELDGKMIRMAGYALPLEFTDTAVSEFLLVPYVGACIHVPPPPANQTVLVHFSQSYKAKSLYEPVWVTGRLKVVSTNKSLAAFDGRVPVETGYSLEGVRIEPFKE